MPDNGPNKYLVELSPAFDGWNLKLVRIEPDGDEHPVFWKTAPLGTVINEAQEFIVHDLYKKGMPWHPTKNQ